MDDDFEPDVPARPWQDRLGDWVRPTPAETAGLLVLLVGALAATALAVWQAAQRPSPSTGAAAIGIGGSFEEHGTEGGATSGHDGHGHDGHGAAAGHDGHGSVPTAPADLDATGTLVVHVTGAVARPGIVELSAGARVAEAIEAAGGPAADAALDQLNLARPLEDGEHVHLPRPGEAPRSDGPGRDEGDQPGGRVDLNRADETQLQTLPGIGPSKAQAIIRHRDEHGPFGVPGDLRAVPGIGEKTFQQLAELVTVS